MEPNLTPHGWPNRHSPFAAERWPGRGFSLQPLARHLAGADARRAAVQALQLYAEGIHDDQELAKCHKAIVLIQSILAEHSKNRDAAMATTPAMKHIRRT